jgi:hypothetical protein
MARAYTGNMGVGDRQRTAEHLGECVPCRRLVIRVMLENGGEFLRASSRERAPSGCPDESDWMRLAAGLSTGRDAELLEHACDCGACGRLLREAQEAFSDELTAEENNGIAQLPMSGLAERSRFAARISRPAPAAPVGGLRWWRRPMAWAAACGVVLVAGGFWFWNSRSDDGSAALLARAYTEERTFEFRIPGAGYAPLRERRAADQGSRLSRPGALIEAEARISRDLTKGPDSTALLEWRGRA